MCSVVLLVAVAVRCRIRASRRLAWLDRQSLLLTAHWVDLKLFRTIVTIDFGTGNEVWITRLSEHRQLLDDRRAVINQGFRFRPAPHLPAVRDLWRTWGLEVLEIWTLPRPAWF